MPRPAPAVPTPTPAAPPARTPEVQPSVERESHPVFEAFIESVDLQAKTIRVKSVPPAKNFVVTLRDDTALEVVAGVRSRLDEYLDAHAGQFPFKVGDKVKISWTQNATTKKINAITIARAK